MAIAPPASTDRRSEDFRSSLASEGGFTLLELMIVAGMSVIVIGTMVMFAMDVRLGAAKHVGAARSMADGDTARAMIGNDIRAAGARNRYVTEESQRGEVQGTMAAAVTGANRAAVVERDYDIVAISPRQITLHTDAIKSNVGLECVDYTIAATGAVMRSVYLQCSPLNTLVEQEQILGPAPPGAPATEIDTFSVLWKDSNCNINGPVALTADARTNALDSSNVIMMNRIVAVKIALHVHTISGEVRGTVQDANTFAIRSRTSPLYAGAMGNQGANCLG